MSQFDSRHTIYIIFCINAKIYVYLQCLGLWKLHLNRFSTVNANSQSSTAAVLLTEMSLFFMHVIIRYENSDAPHGYNILDTLWECWTIWKRTKWVYRVSATKLFCASTMQLKKKTAYDDHLLNHMENNILVLIQRVMLIREYVLQREIVYEPR